MGKLTVHCRTGSLEKSTAKETFKKSSSLPHRQLRKDGEPGAAPTISSLPHRQLRNICLILGIYSPRSLPHRQLRKVKRS